MGSDPPEWVKYLSMAEEWRLPPWELERLDNEDEEASLWIERALIVKNLIIEKLKKDIKTK